MDTENVLLAIEEKKRWEERALAIERQLADLRGAKAKIQAELKSVDDKMRYYTALAESFREYSVAKASGLYFMEGTRHIR